MPGRSRSSIDSRCLMRATSWRLGDGDLVGAVELGDAHVHALGAVGREVLADVVGADRQLAVAAVGQHGELDARRAAVVEQRVDRGAHGAAGVEHVVDEHDRVVLEPERQVAGADLGRLARGEVVAVEGDVDLAGGQLGLEQVGDEPVQAAWRDGRRGGGCRRARPAPSGFFSTISCAIRTSVRLMSSSAARAARRSRPRSSARSIASGEVPSSGTPAASSPAASLSGVWPPNCTITPSGFSTSTIFITSSKVSGSKYSRSDVS